MPEINPFNNPNFIKEISKEKEKENLFRNPEGFERIAKDFGIRKLGSGNECFVVDDPESKEKVIALNYKNFSPEDAKDIYYSSKVWNTLFPHNFPKIHAASAQTKDGSFNGTVRQKIDGKTLHDQKYSFKQMIESDFKEKTLLLSVIKNIKNYILNKKTEAEYPFSQALKEMEILSAEPYNIPFFIDGNDKNFIKTDNGDEYYVDTMRMGSRLSNRINVEAIESYMREKAYKDSDITKVVSSITRLRTIFIKNT